MTYIHSNHFKTSKGFHGLGYFLLDFVLFLDTKKSCQGFNFNLDKFGYVDYKAKGACNAKEVLEKADDRKKCNATNTYGVGTPRVIYENG